VNLKGDEIAQSCNRLYALRDRGRSNTGTACPSCSKAWTKDKPLTRVGEEAGREGDGSDKKRRLPPNSADDSEDNDHDATRDHLPNSPPQVDSLGPIIIMTLADADE
jgi:hypothetical protein